jgi:hypothetical protein
MYYRIAMACLALLMALSFAACKDGNLEKYAYQVIDSANVVYDTSMKISAELYRDGTIDKEDWRKIAKIGNKVRATGHSAAVVMRQYHVAVEDHGADSSQAEEIADKATAILFNLMENAKELQANVRDIAPGVEFKNVDWPKTSELQ